MPIRAENKARYPKDWRAIVEHIRKRSGGRCECTGQCGRFHYRVAGRRQLDLKEADPLRVTVRCAAVDRKPHPSTGSMVVLTVMHLNHTPEDVDDENLLHGCQACHLRYDAPMKAQGRRERGRVARGDLFGGKE